MPPLPAPPARPTGESFGEPAAALAPPLLPSGSPPRPEPPLFKPPDERPGAEIEGFETLSRGVPPRADEELPPSRPIGESPLERSDGASFGPVELRAFHPLFGS
jgi:hypothetical protein